MFKQILRGLKYITTRGTQVSKDEFQSHQNRETGVKAHRSCLSLRPWERDGFESEAHYDLHHWGPGRCAVYVEKGTKNPRYLRAKKAIETLEPKKSRLKNLSDVLKQT